MTALASCFFAYVAFATLWPLVRAVGRLFLVGARAARRLVARMRPALARPEAAAVAPACARDNLQRFRPEVREAVERAASSHERLGDLASSCPAALVAIAAPGDDPEAARAADAGRALVVAGRPLAEVCAALGVPLWLRRARPETFRARPPALADAPELRQAIGPFVPTGAGAIGCAAHDPARWFDIVLCAFETADEAVGVWAARCAARTPEQVWDHHLRLVFLWAWFARRSGEWSDRLAWQRAVQLADAWRTQMEFAIFGGPDLWALAEAEVEGFAFVPLATDAAIAEEGAAMSHCVASYARDVANGECALWSVRRGGERVATLELGDSCGGDFVTVRQLFGRGNAAAERAVWRAATVFSLDRAEAAAVAAAWRPDNAQTRRAWEALFAPYWAAKGGVRSWAPLTPAQRALHV